VMWDFVEIERRLVGAAGAFGVVGYWGYKEQRGRMNALMKPCVMKRTKEFHLLERLKDQMERLGRYIVQNSCKGNR